jgi:hypothetical protein
MIIFSDHQEVTLYTPCVHCGAEEFLLQPSHSWMADIYVYGYCVKFWLVFCTFHLVLFCSIFICVKCVVQLGTL